MTSTPLLTVSGSGTCSDLVERSRIENAVGTPSAAGLGHSGTNEVEFGRRAGVRRNHVRRGAGGGNRDRPAGDVMSEDLCTSDSGSGFYEAADLMSERGIRRLPVCDADGDLTGILTTDDLTELLADEQQRLGGVIRAQRPPF